MTPTLDEALLDRKLAELEKARPWSPRVIYKLEAFLRAADDAEVFRINPVGFAGARGVAVAEATDLFLHATKLGFFRMDWHILCPSCGDVVSSFSTLRTVDAHFFCHLCHLDSVAKLDDFIMVSFTVTPEVRDIVFNHPERIPVGDYLTKVHFSRLGRLANGEVFGDTMAKMSRSLAYVEPGNTWVVALEAGAGFLLIHDFLNNSGVVLPLKGAAKAGTQRVPVQILDGKLIAKEEYAWPGSIEVTVENASAKRGAVAIVVLPPDYFSGEHPLLTFDPFLSGKGLFTNQSFRDLFQLETIRGTEGIGVQDLTLLFTDLKGSTAMYDRIGDLKAFALVQQHFHRLGRVVRGQDGAIVKTIGDAIMASFQTPAGAVKAALEMLEEIEQFNQEHGAREIILKIGVHRCATIAVTLNDRLDYFGQTVNIAARVQGLADAEEIYLTEDVYNAPGVRELLKAPFRVEARQAQLKGIEQSLVVYRVAANGVTKTPKPRAKLAKAAPRKPARVGKSK